MHHVGNSLELFMIAGAAIRLHVLHRGILFSLCLSKISGVGLNCWRWAGIEFERHFTCKRLSNGFYYFALLDGRRKAGSFGFSPNEHIHCNMKADSFDIDSAILYSQMRQIGECIHSIQWSRSLFELLAANLIRFPLKVGQRPEFSGNSTIAIGKSDQTERLHQHFIPWITR